jgi:hypothetical protein
MDSGNAICGPRIGAGVAALGLAATIAGCAPPKQPFPDLPRLSVSPQVNSRNLCGLGVSPAIGIPDAPPDTARFQLRMTNVDVLFQAPWQVTLPAQPGGIAEGAASDYPAPCLGARQVYLYRFEVLALDAAAHPLAYGQTVVYIWPLDRTLAAERAATGQPVSRARTMFPAPEMESEPPVLSTPQRIPSPILPIPAY